LIRIVSLYPQWNYSWRKRISAFPAQNIKRFSLQRSFPGKLLWGYVNQ
jgi:hypothetical protein